MEILNNLIKIKGAKDIRPTGNNVLIRIDTDVEKIKFESGSELYIDPTYEVGFHAYNSGVVVKAPEEYHYNPTHDDWEPEIDIIPGDLVFFDYLTGLESPKLQDGEEIYFLVPYKILYAAKRNEKIICLNGYILCTPETEKVDTSLWTPDKVSNKIAVVDHAGKVNKRYKPIKRGRGNQYYYPCDDPAVVAGVKIMYPLKHWVSLEHELHRRLDKPYKVVQNRFVEAII